MSRRTRTDVPIHFLHEEMILCAETGDLYLKKDRKIHKAGIPIVGYRRGDQAKNLLVKLPEGGTRVESYARVVFAMTRGHYPKHNLLFLNGDKADCRPENLYDMVPPKNEEDIPIELLHLLFCYDGINGVLVRRLGTRGTHVGAVAGGDPGTSRVSVSVLDKKILIHRVIKAMHLGYWPKYVDHEDHNPFNNRIENLRECTKAQNSANVGITKRNTSGAKGVSFAKASGKWRAEVASRGERVFLKYFDSFDEAVSARREAAELYHGEFACHN